MPNLHDIERRINSVTSTKQITRTMEMVAAAKVRRATERVEAATPYSDSMIEMLASVAERVGGTENALAARSMTRSRTCSVVVVASDRGLAGGFNSNVLRHVEAPHEEQAGARVSSVQVVACGKKAIGYFTYRKIDPVLAFADLSADPTVDEAPQSRRYAIDGVRQGGMSTRSFVVYNHAKNAAEQELREETVLPVDTAQTLPQSELAADDATRR